MKAEYYIINPTGNITALVTSAVPVSLQASAAKQLFNEVPAVEQVGFIENISDKKVTVRMSGGEFCGNCALSVSAFYNYKNNLLSSEISVDFIDSYSGVQVLSESENNNNYNGKVIMPSPTRIRNEKYYFGGREYNFPTVEYNGITHIICDDIFLKDTFKNAVKNWCMEKSLRSLGVMFFNLTEKTVIPLVYVAESDALYFENSCASGTAAIGEYLYKKGESDVDLTLKEPMGDLRVVRDKSGTILYGKTQIVSKNTIDFSI